MRYRVKRSNKAFAVRGRVLSFTKSGVFAKQRRATALLVFALVFGTAVHGGIRTYASQDYDNLIKITPASCATPTNQALVGGDRTGIRLVLKNPENPDRDIRIELDHKTGNSYTIPETGFNIVDLIIAFNESGGVQIPVVYGEQDMQIIKTAGSIDTLLATKKINLVDPASLDCYEYQASHSLYVYSERYINANNFGPNSSNSNVAVQIAVPIEASHIRVAINGDMFVSEAGLDTKGDDNLYKSGLAHGRQVWRIKKSLPAGVYNAIAEYRIKDRWHPVAGGSATIYSLNKPTFSVQYPNEKSFIYRANDANMVRLKVEDEYKSFQRAEFKIGEETYTVNRADDIDLRQEGDYVLVDVTKSKTWSGLTEGEYSVQVNVWNKANSKAHADYISTHKLVIDTTNPVVSDFTSADLVPAADKNNSKLPVTARVADNTGLSQIRYYLAEMPEDGKPRNNLKGIREAVVSEGVDGVYSAEIDVFGLNGKYVLLAAAKDLAANNTTPIFKVIDIDGEFASVGIKSPADKEVVKGIHRFVVESNEDIAKWLFTLDGKSYGSKLQRIDSTNSWYVDIDTDTLKDGDYRITLRSTDKAGNVKYWNNNSRIVMHTFTVDNTAPGVVSGLSLTERPNGAVVGNGSATKVSGITAKWDSKEDAVSYEYRYWNNIESSLYKEENPWVHNVGNSTSYPGTVNQGEGMHYFCVVAIDQVGNRSPCSETFAFFYDASRPTATIDNTNLADDSSKLTIDVTVKDFVSGVLAVEVNIYDSVNGGEPLVSGLGRIRDKLPIFTTSESVDGFEIDVSGLDPGSYTLRLVGLDHAGNYSSQQTTTFVIPEPPVVEEDQEDIDADAGSGEDVDVDENPDQSTNTGSAVAGLNTGGQGQQGSENPSVPRSDGSTGSAAGASAAGGGTIASAENGVRGIATVGDVNTSTDARERSNDGVNNRSNSNGVSVLSAQDTFANSQSSSEDINSKGCSKLMGLCWYYWIPVVVVAVVSTYFMVREKDDRTA